jgi:chemotaxis protein CheD
MNDPLNVGLGEVVISRNRRDVLVSYGLGSCLGICMVDPEAHICGLLHAVLPVRMNGNDPRSAKFVDSGIEGLLAGMLEQGANRRRLIVRMAGGANMLLASGVTSMFDIGTRNIDSAHQVFQRLGLALKAEEIGGHLGRTVHVYLADCRMTVRVVNGIEKEI